MAAAPSYRADRPAAASRSPSTRLSGSVPATLLIAAMALPIVSAHEHGVEHIQAGDTVSEDPIDTILWVHIFTQMFAFGILFPVGMVLGIIKSRWHVPVQVLGTLLSILGLVLAHQHGGRQFLPTNVHGKFANILYLQLLVQVCLGVYLRLHLERGINGRIRPILQKVHSIHGKIFPITSWVQMLFGGITALGFCQGDHLGQCAAHFIMGSAFIAYGILLTIVLLVGQLWLKRTGRSQEFFDSATIAAWGCVNTFTEHRWGTAWVKNDWQHTTMGIIWWSAGLAGVWLARSRDGQPRRNFIPAFVIFITGWAMSAHPQELMVSAMTHKMFGYTLMATGVTRIIEIGFVTKDKVGVSEDGRQINSFQYIPVFLLYAAGFLFMGATEEQMNLVASSPMDHVSYILILYSLAFLVFLFVNILVHMYDRSANPPDAVPKSLANGRRAGASGHAVSDADRQQLRDVEEFELDGLISGDEEEDEVAASRRLLKEQEIDAAGSGESSLGSPNTIGRNSDRVAR